MGSKSKNVLRFVAAADDNNAKYRCEAANVMVAEPLVAEIVMSVFCKFFLYIYKIWSFSMAFRVSIFFYSEKSLWPVALAQSPTAKLV